VPSSRSTLSYVAVIATALSLHVGCVTPALAKGGKNRKAEGNDSQPPAMEGARVGGRWQKQLIDRLKSEKFDEAWGMFSEGGWSDVGQVMLLANGSRDKFVLLTVKPNEKEGFDTKAFSKNQWESLSKFIEKSATLGDIDEPMFDGLVYEYVHLRRDAEGKVTLAKRVYIKSTGREPHQDHDALVKAFFDLRADKT
jgi:hypothetical protein